MQGALRRSAKKSPFQSRRVGGPRAGQPIITYPFASDPVMLMLQMLIVCARDSPGFIRLSLLLDHSTGEGQPHITGNELWTVTTFVTTLVLR